MSTTRSRAYTIDADPPAVCHPIIFTDHTPLSTAYGTVIIVEGIEHMRTYDGWVDTTGEVTTNEDMRDYLMRHQHASYVAYNAHRTSY